MSSLDALPVCLYSCQVTCLCFHPLWVSFYVWVWPGTLCISMQAFWSFWWTSSLLGCSAPEVGVGDPWILQNVSFSSLQDLILQHATKQIPKRPKPTSLKPRAMSLFITISASLRILNSSISWSLQPRLPLTFTFPIKPFFVGKTEVQQSESLHWLLYCLEKDVIINTFQELLMPCCVVLTDIQVAEIPHKAANIRLLPSICRGPLLLSSTPLVRRPVAAPPL